MPEEVIKYEEAGGRSVLAMNRQESLISMSLELNIAWIAKLHEAEHDP